MRIHKELFDALIQYRFEEIRCSGDGIDEILYSDFLDLRKFPSPVSLKQVVYSQNYGKLVTNILRCKERSDDELTVEYLKDVYLIGVSVSSTGGLYRAAFAG